MPSSLISSASSLNRDHRITLGWFRSRRHQPLQLLHVFRRGIEVAGLVHHEHAQAVADIEQLPGRWIVRGAVGVRTHLLQFTDAELPDRIRYGNADARMILVIARALQFKRPVVEKKSLLRIESNRAEAAGDIRRSPPACCRSIRPTAPYRDWVGLPTRVAASPRKSRPLPRLRPGERCSATRNAHQRPAFQRNRKRRYLPRPRPRRARYWPA